MNGDDPRMRRVPPHSGGPGRAGARRPPPPQGGRPPVEPPQVTRRNPGPGQPRPTERYEPPQAWSQTPQGRHAPPRPPAPGRGGKPHPPTHAPTQRPVPYREGGHAPTQRPVPFRDDRRRPPPTGNPPGRRPAAPPSRRPRRKRHIGRWFLAIALALLALLIYGVVKVDGSLTRIDALTDYEDRVGNTAGTNWLLVGSDSRAGLSEEQTSGLATGGEVGDPRTDTIILVHVPPSGRTTLVSLPRDSYVAIPGYGQDKLNAAFAFGGAPLLTETVETATGLRIDHYAEIGFAGFAGVVDALGGIDVCVPQAINDPLAGIDLPAGCQELNGPQALGFVRSRATALADIDRMNNQRLFLSALLEKATSPATLANPFALWPMVSDTAGSLTVDKGDHIWDLARLAWALRGDTLATTVPVGGFTDTDSGNVLLWADPDADRFFQALADGDPIPADLAGDQ
ncbi:LCP family protein [Nocardia sienata]|uniref:LCP family protein n=1 Tax=Nocardia sienata TaxID=248552 RepID=UPI000A03FF40|nr:LCP family protein [Nocardia sienata]